MSPAVAGAPEDQSSAQRPTSEVVVGYDGSPSSVMALRWAAAEAGARAASLRVLCVADLDQRAGPDTLTTVRRRFRTEQEAAEKLSDEGVRIATQVAGGLLDRWVTAQEVLGEVSAALLEACEHADLLVLGHRGLDALVGAPLESVAFSVVAAAACPVVVLRGSAAPAADPPLAVVLGIDVSAEHEPVTSPALMLAARTAQRRAAPLRVLAAVEAGGPPAGDDGPAATEDLSAHHRSHARRSLDAVSAAARHLYPDLDVRTDVVTGRPADALTVASEDAALVVVSARSTSAVPGPRLGSVTHEVIHRATCPVAVARTKIS